MLLHFIFSLISFGWSDPAKPIVMDLSPSDTLVIVIPDGQVRTAPVPGNQATIKITKTAVAKGESDDDWNMTMERHGSRVELKVRVPDSRVALTNLLKNEKVPRFTLEARVPAVALEIAARKGGIRVENHAGPLKLQLLSGEINVTGGDGPIGMTHQEGAVVVRGHRGPVRCESYQGKILAESVTGALDIENFMGDTTVKGSEGNLNLTATRGTSRIAGQKGRIDFWQGRGSLIVDDLQGPLKGQTQQGAIAATVTGEADVRLTSQEGPISLKLKDSKAYLQLTTQDGNIVVPNPLRVTDMGSQKTVRGRLSGSVPGTINIKSDSGSIRVH